MENDNKKNIIIDEIEKFNLLRGRFCKLDNREINFIKEFVSELNLPYCVPEYGEGEAICSKIAAHLKKKYNYEDVYVLSKDTDCLVFGSPKWLKSYSQDTDYFEYLNLNEVLNGLNLTHKEFQIVCICMGCDFNTNQMLKIPRNKLKQYGNLKADKLVNSVKGCKTLMEYHDRIKNEVIFDLELYNKAMVCFNELYSIKIKLPDCNPWKQFKVNDPLDLSFYRYILFQTINGNSINLFF